MGLTVTHILNVEKALLNVWHTNEDNEVEVNLDKILSYADNLRILSPSKAGLADDSPIIGISKFFFGTRIR